MDVLVSLLVVAIRLVTPVIIASIGALFCERSGVTNLGLEGIMLIGALSAVLGSFYTGSAWLGVLAGLAGGAAAGLLHAVIVVRYGGDQTISGIGLFFFGSGFTAYIVQVLFNSSFSKQVTSIQSTGFLENIPFAGRYLSQFSPLTYLAFLIVPLAFYIMEKTPLGLRVKAAGDDPKAVETAGINLWAIRFFCVILCGALGGLAGAYMSIGQMNRFVSGMVAGRGMLALVAVKMGRWKPFGVLAACLFFGFFDSLQLKLQVDQVLSVPPELIQMIPYILGFIALVLSSRTSANPLALGKPYVRNTYIS